MGLFEDVGMCCLNVEQAYFCYHYDFLFRKKNGVKLFCEYT